jgi:hypothetical protein
MAACRPLMSPVKVSAATRATARRRWMMAFSSDVRRKNSVPGRTSVQLGRDFSGGFDVRAAMGSRSTGVTTAGFNSQAAPIGCWFGW